MDEIDMEVHHQTSAAAQAAIAIAAAWRVEPTRRALLEGEIPRPSSGTSMRNVAEDFADEDIAAESEYATDEAEGSHGHFYVEDKNNKSSSSQVSQDQSNVSTSSYSSSLENSDNDGEASNTSVAPDGKSYYSFQEDENHDEDNNSYRSSR
jgi:hypothetical protein